MPYSKKFNELGVIDPITIIGVLFLSVTIGIATYVVSDKDLNLNIGSRAKAILEGEEKYLRANRAELDRRIDKRREEIALEEENEGGQNSTPVQQPATPKFIDGCNVNNGGKVDVGAKVVGGANVAGENYKGTSGYATCDANLGWIDCPDCKITDLTTVPEYKQQEYQKALELEKIASELEKQEMSISGDSGPNNNVITDQPTTQNNTVGESGSENRITIDDIHTPQDESSNQTTTTNTNSSSNASSTVPSNTAASEQINNLVKNMLNDFRNMPGMEWYNYFGNQNFSQINSYYANTPIIRTNSGSGFGATATNSRPINTFSSNTIVFEQNNDLIKNLPGMEWYNYFGNQDVFKPSNYYTTTPKINQNTNFGKNNKAGTQDCDSTGFTLQFSDDCTNIPSMDVYNNPTTRGYLNNYTLENPTNYLLLNNNLDNCLLENNAIGGGQNTSCYYQNTIER